MKTDLKIVTYEYNKATGTTKHIFLLKNTKTTYQTIQPIASGLFYKKREK